MSIPRRYPRSSPATASLLVLSLVGLLLGACGDDEAEAQPSEPSSSHTGSAAPSVVSSSDQGPPFDESDLDPDCDPLNAGHCAFPWPSSLYLEDDPDRATGFTLAFGDRSLPDINGLHIEPGAFRRMDGYGLGVPIMALFPNLDTAGMAREYDTGPSLAEDAPVLLFRVDGETLARVPYWTELDSRERRADARTFIVRPAVILEEGTRYIVAFRNLRDTEGAAIPRSEAFDRLAQGRTRGSALLEPRQERFDDLLDRLEQAGVSRDELTLAWDFVTASSDALHGTVLRMRDDAFEATAPRGPELTITEIIRYLPESDGTDTPTHEHIALQVSGTFRVPHFLESYQVLGAEFWRLHRDSDGRVVQNGWRDAPFLVRVPHSAMDGTPHGLVTYGHGLLGTRFEIRAGHIGRLANEFGWIIVGADLAGMSSDDAGRIQSALQDMTHITTMTDRLHQGIVEYLLLTRGMRERLEEALAEEDFEIAIDREAVAYFGGSQGGIFGQTYMALTTDVRYGYLAVPGTNYSTLLQRSTGFTQFAGVLGALYRGSGNLLALLATVQLLWDATDPVSWVRRIPNPFDGQDERRALSVVAKADYQVAVSTMENVVRSGFGIPAVGPWDRERPAPPGFTTVPYPHAGSGVINFDFGNPWPNGDNQPPSDAFGDPHSLHATLDEAGIQLDHFLRFGEIIDICDGGPCTFLREPGN